MITERIALREDDGSVHLQTYLLHDSPDFQTGAARPAVVVCPGGGYRFTSDREAEPVALRFLARGYQVFVLRYSVGTEFPAPMLDLARAIATVRERAQEWRVDPGRVVVCGFSAGGHLAASLGVFWDEPWLTGPLGVPGELLRPDALLLCYPVIDLEVTAGLGAPWQPAPELVQLVETMVPTVLGDAGSQELKRRYRPDLHVAASTPPTFLWHTAEDELVPSSNTLAFAAALARHRVPHEVHVFGHGGHGLSLGDETTDTDGGAVEPAVQVWPELALAWLARRGLAPGR